MTKVPLDTPTRMLSLRFFGAMGGSSESHTNAYFIPDDETLVLIDISLVHIWKVKQLLEAMEYRLKHVYLCVTHAHLDHISGVTHLAYLVRYICPDVKLMIYTEGVIGAAVKNILIATGGGRAFPVSKLGTYEFGNAYSVNRPKWLSGIIKTQHAPNLPSGAVGFEFKLKRDGEERTLIYSGDTAILKPFQEQLLKHGTDENLELYLDIATVDKKGMHLRWSNELATTLVEMLETYPNLAIGLMHYNDWLTLKGEVLKLNQPRLVVVESV